MVAVCESPVVLFTVLAVLGNLNTEGSHSREQTDRSNPTRPCGISHTWVDPHLSEVATSARVVLTKGSVQEFSVAYCHTLPSAELHDTAQVLLCCRPPRTRYIIKLAEKRCWKRMFISLLLMMGGIEPNPGPANSKSLSLNVRLINARSIVNKSALIHDVIKDNRLDLLAVTETWVYEDSPPVLKKKRPLPATQSFTPIAAPRARAEKSSVGVELLSFTARIFE